MPQRDLALIVLAGVVAVGVLVAVVVLTIADEVEPVAAMGTITAVAGIAGFALGRLSGAPAPALTEGDR